MLRAIPVLNPYANLHLHELDNLYDINEFKRVLRRKIMWHDCWPAYRAVGLK